MARPKLAADIKLSKRFVFRLSEDEWRLLEGIAAATGKTMGVAVRNKLFTGKYPKAKSARIDLQTYAELKKIGVNLNQLAKKANANILPNDIREHLQKLLYQQNLIIKLLLHDSQSEGR